MVPVAEGKDPLGVSGRVSNRLAGQLLYCITSITPRARYFSFLPWCVADYRLNQKGTKQDAGLEEAIRLRERALTLGSIAHHDGQPCAGGRLVGTEKAQEWYKTSRQRSPKLTSLSFTKDPALKAYYASLLNLGTFVEQEAVELDETGMVLNGFSFDDLELTPLGQELADRYGQAVKKVPSVRKISQRPNECKLNELAAWGARGGLCELTADGPDLEILRELFFCYKGKSDGAHPMRRDTLVLLLEIVDRLSVDGYWIDRTVFNDAVYFGQITSDYSGKDADSIRFNRALRDIVDRWRMFHFHYYLSVGLESLFVYVVRQAREAGLRGVAHADLLRPLYSTATQKTVGSLLGRALPQRFLDLTPRSLAAVYGIDIPNANVAGSKAFDQRVRLLHSLSEARLDYLIQQEVAPGTPESAALALIMLSSMLIRFLQWETTDYGNWFSQAVDKPYEDATTPVMLLELRNHFGDFWNTAWSELGKFVVNRFVVRLHEVLSFEKSSSQAKAFFQSDQRRLYWRNLHYDTIAVSNSRLGSALQILIDLGYIKHEPNDNGLYSLTSDGRKRLKSELERMSS
jgi:hypothetical protein